MFFKHKKKNLVVKAKEEEGKIRAAKEKLNAAEERLKKATIAKEKLEKELYESDSYKAYPYMGYLYEHEHSKSLRQQVRKEYKLLPFWKKNLEKNFYYAKSHEEAALALEQLQNVEGDLNRAQAELKEFSTAAAKGSLNYKKICKALKPLEREIELSKWACARARRNYEKKSTKLAHWITEHGGYCAYERFLQC